MKILVAEDEQFLRRLLNETLSSFGLEVELAKDGGEAWEKVQKGGYNIVLLDWIMPNMDGIEVCRKIRASELSDDIYIILLTAKADKEEIIEGFEAGADDYLTKPYYPKELYYRIKAGQRIKNLENSLKEQLAEITETNKEINSHLEAAANVQRSLLPDVPPKIPNIEMAWIYKASEKIGGDMFNFFRLDEKHLGFYILDVSGHGIPAALLSVALRHQLQPQNGTSSIVKKHINKPPYYELADPNEVLGILNSHFLMNTKTFQYFTIIYGLLNFRDYTFTFSRAGHPYPILLNEGEPKFLNKTDGLPIGFMEKIQFQTETVSFSPGDSLYFYTDGITEAENGSAVLFGKDRLVETLAKRHKLPIKQAINEAYTEIKEWNGSDSFDDDISLIGIKIT